MFTFYQILLMLRYFFDKKPPPSILQVNRAKEIAVEFTSMSKTYAMAGWRIGFAVGNKKLIEALTKLNLI